MQKASTFKVYNASAGSGKTFTLVKEYIKVLLSTEHIYTFQKILAVTFTNKAAGEMKERVLKNLEDFSKGNESDLLKQIIKETSLDKEIIKQRSEKILNAILQNYSAFSITTIDSFTHKIIKNFAYDLGLSLNFEVEMDSGSLLNEAVDSLISKIGTDKQLTDLLIQYSLDKTDDDKSWDISKDLNEFAKVLLNEDDIPHFKDLSNKSIEDFKALKKTIQKSQTKIEKEFVDFSDKVLNFVRDNGLDFSDFSYKDYPNHFLKFSKIKALKFGDINFEGRLAKSIHESKKLYAGKTPESSKEIIDDLFEELVGFYHQSEILYKTKYSIYSFGLLALKSVIPLAVLNKVNLELNSIKDENNIRLNAEFNQLISDTIKGQPAPFIYERIGQRFQNYFIDEMQDTSVLQWQNLIPLIDNALAQENSSLLLVGDAKQAIYRWRGGRAEQFIDIGSSKQNLFAIEKKIETLETNYRSFSEIINFNNSFFQHVSNFFQNNDYQTLFKEGNQQLKNNKTGGYVSLSFVERNEEQEEKDLVYSKKVLNQIHHLQNEFSLGEICILTRTKKDGISIANYLSENNIPIVSSETLLLKNSNHVTFIINILKLIQNISDEEVFFEILYFLYDHFQIALPKNTFFKQFAKTDASELFEFLKECNVNFKLSELNQLPFYEKIENIVKSFHLVDSSDAYVQFFLDVVLEQQRKGLDVSAFLEFWELKKESLSIVAAESSDAVKIMTIHKSKGLEFPVVIFPCDVDIYNQIKPKVWLNDLPETFDSFKELLIPFNKSVSLINERGLQIYNQQREELELDNFNLLYVALTRAVEQLYIITEKKISKKGDINKNFFSGVFIDYLQQQDLWDTNKEEYVFGHKKRVSKKPLPNNISENHSQFISTSWQEHNVTLLANSSKLWDTEKGQAIDFGNLIHEMFSNIYSENDVEKVVELYHQKGIINQLELEQIRQLIYKVVHHPDLNIYFKEDLTIFNEREIVDVDSQIIIPDRLVFDDVNMVYILDYKTGQQLKKHHQQISKYGNVLESMSYKVNKKLLIYLNDNIQVVEV